MIRSETRDDIHHVLLERGRANALDRDFLNAIADEVEGLSAAPARGLVLSSEGPIFCAGLDLPALVGLDHDSMVELIDALHRCLLAIFRHPRPTVAAINGHAIAGGALLTLACDQRHMLMGNAKWGLNEAQLGLAMPPSTIELIRYALTRKTMEKVLYGGGLYPAFKAHDMGILDELVEEGALDTAAAAAIEAWTPSVDAFADIKERLHGPTVAAMKAARENSPEWVDLWFSDAVQTGIQRVVADLATRNVQKGVDKN
jgi:enoyl-CoA hydratase/carnithine racemase